jgi:hypothetical protein
MKRRINITIDEELHIFITKKEKNFSKWINESISILSSSIALNDSESKDLEEAKNE